MPIDPVIATRLPLLDGITSSTEALADPGQSARLDEFQAVDTAYTPPSVAAHDQRIPGPHGDIPIRIYTPDDDGAAVRPGLLWLHGGGFIGGDLNIPEADFVAGELSHRAQAVVISVEYRLAVDGVHYPVPHDDAVSAWRWAVAAAPRLGVDLTRLAIGGASAGGNLAAGAALRVRDDGDDLLPRRLLLAYPAMHAVLPPPSEELATKMAEVPKPLRFIENYRDIMENYLGGPAEDAPGYAIPAVAELAGLPPTVLITCEYDDLRASDEDFALLLQKAGVPVEVTQEPGMLHGHLNFDPGLSGTDHSLRIFADALVLV